jgi:hypothetical protein
MLPAPTWLVIPLPSPIYPNTRYVFCVNLSGDHIRRVDHAADGDRAVLRQVYGWAVRNPALYLEGLGYRDAEDFLDPPGGSVKYLVFTQGRPVALLTLIPLLTVRGVFQVGLITDPDAPIRNICKLLRAFMGAVFDRLADTLFVQLPDSPEFSPTRKLASSFGFKQVSPTIFLITKGEYGHAKERKEGHDAADQGDRLHQRVRVLRHHA